MEVVCLDFEGVLVPEIWIEVARHTGIEALRATTRDIPDYDELMGQRLRILADNGLGLGDIQAVINDMGPMDGAAEFLATLRQSAQVVILSDTFYEFAQPLVRQLDWPTLFCHRLITDKAGAITGYALRMENHKRHAVQAFKKLRFRVTAAGDSYNDINMLREADKGILFRAPDNVKAEFPEFSTCEMYVDLLSAICGGK
ncbi:MAG: bifunctional phosphoserine phosphatase/homoserine phosphotransferase ThrH [Proteobacteria bacterium]|nr:bifunctional phosphoserine phosphatase/homoserine phosphotransferase ThrH [Pseudomonadota bacterium]